LALFNREAALPIMMYMNAPRPALATKQQTLGVVLALPDRHARQRELVRASLIARPATPSATHRRAA
jgi:hypothetical protein